MMDKTKKGGTTVATTKVSKDFRVHSISDAGNDNVNVGLTSTDTDTAGLPAGAPAPTYGTTSSGITLLLSKDDAAGIFPGDVYTVAFTKKA